jgi:hypothetical protein
VRERIDLLGEWWTTSKAAIDFLSLRPGARGMLAAIMSRSLLLRCRSEVRTSS